MKSPFENKIFSFVNCSMNDDIYLKKSLSKNCIISLCLINFKKENFVKIPDFRIMLLRATISLKFCFQLNKLNKLLSSLKSIIALFFRTR